MLLLSSPLQHYVPRPASVAHTSAAQLSSPHRNPVAALIELPQHAGISRPSSRTAWKCSWTSARRDPLTSRHPTPLAPPVGAAPARCRSALFCCSSQRNQQACCGMDQQGSKEAKRLQEPEGLIAEAGDLLYLQTNTRCKRSSARGRCARWRAGAVLCRFGLLQAVGRRVRCRVQVHE